MALSLSKPKPGAKGKAVAAAPATHTAPLELRIEPGEQKYDDRHRYFEQNLDPKLCSVAVGKLEAGDFAFLVNTPPPTPAALEGGAASSSSSSSSSAGLAGAIDGAPAAGVGVLGGNSPLRVVALIERKTIADMMSSIVDGRYHDQARRLVDSGAPLIYWLLVGTVPQVGPDAVRIRHAMGHLETLPRTRVAVVETQALLLDWFQVKVRYFEEQSRGLLFRDMPLFQQVQQAGARRRLDAQDVVWLEQVGLVYGVGRAVARAIVRRYPSQLQLLWAYEQRARSFEAKRAASAIWAAVPKVPADDDADYQDEDEAPIKPKSNQKRKAPAAGAKAKGGKRKAESPTALLDHLDLMLHEEVEMDAPVPKGGGAAVVDPTAKTKYVGKAVSKMIRQVFLSEADLASLLRSEANGEGEGNAAAAPVDTE